MVYFQAAIAIMALAPQSYGGVAYDTVRADIREGGLHCSSSWYDIAAAYFNRDRLRYLIAFSIPKTKGQFQSFLISRLGRFGFKAAPFVPILVRVLLDQKSKNRSVAASELGLLGPLAKAAIGPLKRCLNSDDEVLRSRVCLALWRIERRPASIIPTLLHGLSREPRSKPVKSMKVVLEGQVIIRPAGRTCPSEAVHTQYWMLSAIDIIGPSIRSALWPSIYRLRDSPDARVTNMVCSLALTFCPDKSVAARILSAELAKNGINYSTRNNYTKLGTAGVPELMRLLHEPKTRRAALDVLTALGKDGAMAAKLVGTWIDDPDEAIRKQARAALAAFGTSEK